MLESNTNQGGRETHIQELLLHEASKKQTAHESAPMKNQSQHIQRSVEVEFDQVFSVFSLNHFNSPTTMATVALVSLAYADLVAGKDLSKEIFEAYGPGGLGALTISGVPDYVECRSRLLPLGHSLAHAPPDLKSKLEHEPSMWNVGWSHGKEKLGDTPDLAKGS